MAAASPILGPGQRVTVLGMARSGVAAARLARARGATVICADRRLDAEVPEGCIPALGPHDPHDFTDTDLVITSPGVSPQVQVLRAAREAGVPVVGELGLAAGLVQEELGLPIVAITGTNGKSTTTWLSAQLLVQAGFRPFVGGNIGRPLSELLLDPLGRGHGPMGPLPGRPRGPSDIAVVEVSSYQLELPGPLAPRAAVILNLTPDHLERHGDMASYAAAKRAIFDRMGPSDMLAIPPHNPWLSRGLDKVAAKIRYLGLSPGVVDEGGQLVLQGSADDGAWSTEGYSIPGAHNRENLAAALLLAVSVGARRAMLDPRALVGLPHRLERVHFAHGVSWINDSKATNVEAAEVGIAAFSGPLILLLGGQGKAGADYGRLARRLSTARAVLCFGQAGPEIAHQLRSLPVQLLPDLPAAVQAARALAQSGDTVLLSPAAASFDQFQDYEDRGRTFARLAQHPTPAPAGGTP